MNFTWQANWFYWGYYRPVDDFNAKNSNAKKAAQAWAEDAVSNHFNSKDVVFKFSSVNFGYFDSNGSSNYKGIAYLHYTITGNISEKGYPPFNLKVGGINWFFNK